MAVSRTGAVGILIDFAQQGKKHIEQVLENKSATWILVRLFCSFFTEVHPVDFSVEKQEYVKTIFFVCFFILIRFLSCSHLLLKLCITCASRIHFTFVVNQK